MGKKYQVIVTNNDGLWRYQLNDIVEVAGFIPEEEILLIWYIERKGYAATDTHGALFYLKLGA